MKPILLCISILLAIASPLRAAQAGTWSFYQAYNDARQSIAVGQTLYVRYGGNLMVYDTVTEEVRLLSKNDGLTGSDIIDMAYSSTAKCLVIVYADFSIDLLRTDGSVTTLPQIKDASDGTAVLNSLSVAGAEAYMAMSDGLIVLNLKAEEVTGYFRFGQNVACATRVGSIYYVGTGVGMYISGAGDNLADPAKWHLISDVVAQELLPFTDGIYCRVEKSGSQQGLWWLRLATSATDTPIMLRFNEGLYTDGYAVGEQAVFYGNGSATLFRAAAPETPEATYSLPDGVQHLTSTATGTYWAACGMSGLKACAVADGAITPTGLSVGGYGPRRDYCYYLHYAGDRLLIAGGRLDPYDRQHFAGTIMTYENGRWGYFQEDGISDVTGVSYTDITCVAQDPSDSTHHFASAGGTGLYEFRNGKMVNHYSINNSPLRHALVSDDYPESSKRSYVRVDGLNFDAAGNLWMVNDRADSVVCILKTDGTWARIYASDGISYAPTMERTLFDSKGRFWVTSRRTVSERPVHTAGLLCLDYNGTIDNTDDDVATYRTSAYNEDGKNCDLSEGVYDLLQDQNGAIWVGAATGLYVIDDPDTWSNSDFRLTQIKVPRNDGTNYADYLLSGVPVTCMDTDGADWKWIGTANNGVYLVSADGTEVIHHFLADETPLLSDNIYDLAVNQTTGEVMIGTDAGLCSYMGDATAPAERLEKSAVKVYPNPVRPEFSGNVTVTGLTADADVKVTTTGGQVVAAGRSNGGTFTWDCRAASGRRVASGVYYVMVATAGGNQGIAAKIVVI